MVDTCKGRCQGGDVTLFRTDQPESQPGLSVSLQDREEVGYERKDLEILPVDTASSSLRLPVQAAGGDGVSD